MTSEGNQEVKKMVTLKSQDGKEFLVERKAAEQSKMLKNVIEDVYTDDAPIPVFQVPSDALESLLEYCEKHSEEPPSMGDKRELIKHQDVLMQWDYTYMTKVENNIKLFCELILAAHYLEIEGLLDLLSESETFEKLSKIIKKKIAGRDACEFLKRRGIV